jgi:hypothetical protein
MRPASAIVVGDPSDPHVAAVLARLSGDVLVVDAASLSQGVYRLEAGRFCFTRPGSALTIDENAPIRGWLRRLAPPDWQRGITLESRQAAVKTSWLSLLTGVIRTCGVSWLTGVDALIVSESKLLQHDAARRVGVCTPKSIITNDRQVAADYLPDELVLKPLGPGHFFDGEEPFVVFATAIRNDAPELDALAGAPFITQERIVARAHLRIVTVEDRVWAARLDATDRPLDWRRQDAAHRSFHATLAPATVRDGGLRVATALDLGYSSQDWLETDSEPVLLDVNPAGQWLFLPPEVADPVTDAIAAWLTRPVA